VKVTSAKAAVTAFARMCPDVTHALAEQESGDGEGEFSPPTTARRSSDPDPELFDAVHAQAAATTATVVSALPNMPKLSRTTVGSRTAGQRHISDRTFWPRRIRSAPC